MAAALYEAEFYWPEPANKVIVTGTFDNWSQSIPLERTATGFVAKVNVPYAQKVDFKFVVDGQWKVNPHFPTTSDWRGNVNNYIMTPPAPPPAPEPVPEPEPEVVPEPVAVPEPEPLKVDTEEKPVEAHPEPEPVTPVNPPNAIEAAVTPMAVPPSAIFPQEGLSDVDPAVSRQIIEAVLEADKEGSKEVEIAGDKAETLVVSVAEPTSAPKEIVETVVVLDEPLVASPPAITPVVEAAAEPQVNGAVEKVEEKDLATPKEEHKALANGVPAVITTAPTSDPSEAVDLSSPIARPSTPPPKAAPSEPQTPAAVPLPQTPAAVDTKGTVPADEPQPPASAWSTGSTTSTPTKPERPGTLGSIKNKGGSSRTSRIFSFPGRRGSQDGAVDLTPSTPGSVRKDSSESVRKKKNSFMGKVHDLFHPHHKQQASK